MQEESLNLDEHICRLVLKALNRCKEAKKNMKEVGYLLGVSRRSVYRYIAQYKILFENNEWVVKNRKK